MLILFYIDTCSFRLNVNIWKPLDSSHIFSKISAPHKTLCPGSQSWPPGKLRALTCACNKCTVARSAWVLTGLRNALGKTTGRRRDWVLNIYWRRCPQGPGTAPAPPLSLKSTNHSTYIFPPTFTTWPHPPITVVHVAWAPAPTRLASASCASRIGVLESHVNHACRRGLRGTGDLRIHVTCSCLAAFGDPCAVLRTTALAEQGDRLLESAVVTRATRHTASPVRTSPEDTDHKNNMARSRCPPAHKVAIETSRKNWLPKQSTTCKEFGWERKSTGTSRIQ
jgi:hypothetical protein